MFKSKTLFEHLVRGIIGAGGLALAIFLNPAIGLFSWIFIPISLIALRGCPLCWLTGLFETVLHKEKGSLCVDGTCSVRKDSVKNLKVS